ncbi:hypothetical protein GGU45_004219 [Niabella hirudinis]
MFLIKIKFIEVLAYFFKQILCTHHQAFSGSKFLYFEFPTRFQAVFFAAPKPICCR